MTKTKTWNDIVSEALGDSFSQSSGALSVSDVSPAKSQTQTTTLQDAITSAATSAAVNVLNYSKFAVQCEMTTSHSTDVQGSVDGTNWVKIGSSLTTDTIYQFEGKYKYLRVDTTAVSGALTVTLLAGN